jgi:hypothetical protein
MRRELMRMPKRKVLFLDETYIRMSIHPTHTIVAPGHTQYVVAEDTDAYAPRYDMIACVSAERVFPPMIFTPKDRVDWQVKGIRKRMLHTYINDILAQAIEAVDEYGLVLVMDRSSIHNPTEMLEEFQEAGCGIISQVRLMPAYSGKRLNPLDNAIFHDWKEAVRSSCPLTERTIVSAMIKAWDNLPTKNLWAHYHHCALMCGEDPYLDCPDPLAHKHPTPTKTAINV